MVRGHHFFHGFGQHADAHEAVEASVDAGSAGEVNGFADAGRALALFGLGAVFETLGQAEERLLQLAELAGVDFFLEGQVGVADRRLGVGFVDFGRLVGPVLDDVFVIDFRARD